MSYLRLKFRLCFIKTKRLVRITFEGFTNQEIHSDNSAAKQWKFVSRPSISCNLELLHVVFGSTLSHF